MHSQNHLKFDKYFSWHVLHSVAIMQFGSLTSCKPTLFCIVWPHNLNVAAGGHSYCLCYRPMPVPVWNILHFVLEKLHLMGHGLPVEHNVSNVVCDRWRETFLCKLHFPVSSLDGGQYLAS